MTRIALITYGFPESTIVLAKNLATNNCEVDYYYIFQYREPQAIPGFDFSKAKLKLGVNKLTPADAPEAFCFFGDSRVNVFIVCIYIPIKVKSLFVMNFFLTRVVSKINTVKYDHVDIVGQHDILLSFHRFLRCPKKVHTIHEVSNHYLNRQLKSALLNYLFKSNTKIIVHSQESLNKIYQYQECNKERVFKINFGLFETYRFYKPVYLVKDVENYVLFFGFIKAYKGLDILRDAIGLVKANLPKVKFVIAGFGSSPDLEFLKQNKQCIVFNRQISNSELIGLIKKAAVIVCPYKSASQTGITKLTYLFEKPIIASDVGAFSEEVRSGENGLLIEPNSPESLANAILEFYNIKSTFDKIQQGVLISSKSKDYNWSDIAEQTKLVLTSD